MFSDALKGSNEAMKGCARLGGRAGCAKNGVFMGSGTGLHGRTRIELVSEEGTSDPSPARPGQSIKRTLSRIGYRGRSGVQGGLNTKESQLQQLDDASASLEVYRGQGRPPGRFGGQPWTSDPPRSRTAWPYGP